MRILVVAAVMVALVACSTDPDASARDRAEAEARGIAENLELPPGYEIVEIEASRAQTPRENRGGGQSGHFNVAFQPPARLAPSDVLSEFDDWFTGQGMAHATGYGARDECTETIATTEWADSAKVVVLSYSLNGRQHLIIPYGYAGIVTQERSSIETGVPLPACTGA